VTDTTTPPQEVQDLADVRAMLSKLLADGRGDEMVAMVVGLMEKLLTKNSQLEWRLQSALRQLYRKRSEKVSPEQLALFLSQLEDGEAAKANVEVTPPAAPGNSPDSSGDKAKPKTRLRPTRKPLSSDLQREVRTVEPSPEDMRCGNCGGQKSKMGVEVREMLEFVPAKLVVIEERLTKCVCKKCAEGVVMGKATPKPIEGARPGPGLLAKLLVDKYDDSTPLYRQAKEWRRLGAELSTSTMGDWVAGGIDLLEPLWKFARGNTLDRVLVSLDDTHLPVLDRDHPAGIKKGHLWAFIGDFDQVMFYEYTPTWEGEGPRKILAGFKGKFVQADGYAGIDQYFERPDAPMRVGCLGHCRRKFVAALDAKDMRAAVPISLFAQLYAIEAQAREDKLGPDALLARRQALSRPLMDRLGEVVEGLRGKAVPKSPMGKAITYTINQWSTLVAFLTDGRIPIDNLHVERRHRTVALGRRNYLFCGSDEGARRHAIISTVLGNCALAGVNSFAYLRDVIAKLAGDWPSAKIAELMPAAWAAAQKKTEDAQAQQSAVG
jgi:transposase